MISLGKTLAKTSGVNLAKQALKENPVRSAVCENSDIKNPKSWGKNAIICDGWADIAMPATRGIEFYEKFFGIDSSKNSLQFCLQDKTF